MDRQLINDTFEFSITVEDDYGFILLYTETKKPAKTKKALLELLVHLPEHVTDEERFLVSKRKLLGNYIQTFDHISALSSFLTEYFISGVDLFQLFEVIHEVQFSDLKTAYAGIPESSIAVVHYHP
jgi:predicted Zn-dependent peptidase